MKIIFFLFVALFSLACNVNNYLQAPRHTQDLLTPFAHQYSLPVNSRYEYMKVTASQQFNAPFYNNTGNEYSPDEQLNVGIATHYNTPGDNNNSSIPTSIAILPATKYNISYFMPQTKTTTILQESRNTGYIKTEQQVTQKKSKMMKPAVI